MQGSSSTDNFMQHAIPKTADACAGSEYCDCRVMMMMMIMMMMMMMSFGRQGLSSSRYISATYWIEYAAMADSMVLKSA